LGEYIAKSQKGAVPINPFYAKKNNQRNHWLEQVYRY